MLAKGFKALIGIGGGFVSSLSTIQIKEILQRKEKIGVFNMIKIRLKSMKDKNEKSDSSEMIHIEEIMWKLVEKTALGWLHHGKIKRISWTKLFSLYELGKEVVDRMETLVDEIVSLSQIYETRTEEIDEIIRKRK